jgi:glutathione S-transferase
MKIVIGNKKYSSWSLRPWLALKLTGAPFEETVIPLDMDDTAQNIRKYSPSGRVPALVDDTASQSGDSALTVWDSFAICEYLHEKFPQAQLWPADPAQRARARSVAAEMHSGFQNLRNDCAMKIVEEKPAAARLRPETQADVARIVEIWGECLKASGGPFLFGKKPCIADCFYAPVVSRFRTYKIDAPPAVRPYMDAVWAWPALQEWVSGAHAESLRAKNHED